SITMFLAEDQTRKLPLVGEIKQELGSVQFAEPDRKPVNLTNLSVTLYRTGGYVQAALTEVQKEEPTLTNQFAALDIAIKDFRKELFHGDAARVATNSIRLAQFQQALFDDVRDTFQAMRNQDNSAPLRAQDLPQALRDRF